MYIKFKESDFPQGVFINENMKKHILMTQFINHVETLTGDKLTDDIAINQCSIRTQNSNQELPIVAIYFNNMPIVRLFKTNDIHELHVLDTDSSIDEMLRHAIFYS